MKYQDASTALDTHIKSKKNLSTLEARQLILAEMKKAEEERRYLSYKEYDFTKTTMNKIIYVEIGTKGMGYALTESIRAFEASPSMQTLEEAVTQTAKKAFEDLQNPRAYSNGTELLDCESLLKQKEIVVKIIVREGEL